VDGSSTAADMRIAATAGALVINEVFPHGSDELTDPDWAELKNIGATAIDLSGYQVRDDKTKATIPDGTSLSPGPASPALPAAAHIAEAFVDIDPNVAAKAVGFNAQRVYGLGRDF